jgi:cell division septum initiation protein DivIVA
VIEKILQPGEDLPESWPVEGTTGYDAMREVFGVLLDPAGEAAFTSLADQLGVPTDYARVEEDARRMVTDKILVAEVRRIAALLAGVDTDAARAAVAETMIAFGVYRSYLTEVESTWHGAIAEARSEANKIVGEARSRAEGLERDARAKADALERDAQEKHRVAMGSLESARATLERKVEDLRGFEREYRTRLKSYLESQLRQLETQADDSLAPPRTPATASLPPSPAPSMAPAGAGVPSYGGNQGMGGPGPAAPSYGGQQQMSPAMTQPMAPVRPQGPSPMGQAPSPMRGFLIDEDDN